MIYFDSAYVAKFYLTEPDSERVRALAEREGQVCCSALGRVEASQVFHRKLREAAASRTQVAALFEQFDADCAIGLWTWLPVTEDLIADAAAIFRRLASRLVLRTADAIHLASARQHGLEIVYTNDRHMLAAVGEFGLRGKSV